MKAWRKRERRNRNIAWIYYILGTAQLLVLLIEPKLFLFIVGVLYLALGYCWWRLADSAGRAAEERLDWIVEMERRMS